MIYYNQELRIRDRMKRMQKREQRSLKKVSLLQKFGHKPERFALYTLAPLGIKFESREPACLVIAADWTQVPALHCFYAMIHLLSQLFLTACNYL